MYFTNPYGWLALLGIPVVLAIHFFQRRSRSLPVSTLFLIQQTQRESASGRRFERLLSSPPLWLQLLMVLLLTWFLVGPRYQKSQSVQRIAIVMDSSASMMVFKEKARAKLLEEIDGLQGRAEGAEYFLLNSNAELGRIYHGSEKGELLGALEDWKPSDGVHDVSDSLRMARSMVGAKGVVVFVTDAGVEYPPHGCSVLAVGHEAKNCGITGVKFLERDGDLLWQVSVKNYAGVEQVRHWSMVLAGGTRSEAREIRLPARGVVVLQGKFPTTVKRCRVEISEDVFTLDDTLALVRPEPKELRLMALGADRGQAIFTEKLVRSFINVERAVDRAEVDVVVGSQVDAVGKNENSIVSVRPKAGKKKYLTGVVVAEKHELMEGLNWQSLLVKDVDAIPAEKGDEVLLWQGDRPLIFLRSGAKESLVFNFSLVDSNAEKQESFAVLLWRFLERLRKRKVGYEARVVETGQPLSIARSSSGEGKPKSLLLEKVDLAGGRLAHRVVDPLAPMRAPDEPGFFELKEGDVVLFSGAAYFADTREADFVDCEELDVWAVRTAQSEQEHLREDRFWRYVVFVILAALLASWYWSQGSVKSKLESGK